MASILHKGRFSVSVPEVPDCSCTAAQLADDMGGLTAITEPSAQSKNAASVTTIQEAIIQVELTLSFVKTDPKADIWRNRVKENTFIGDIYYQSMAGNYSEIIRDGTIVNYPDSRDGSGADSSISTFVVRGAVLVNTGAI